MEINNKADAPIGVFDSGVGGLTVAREIMRQLPSENMIYLEIRQECLMEVSREITLFAFQGRSFVSCGQST